MNGEDARPYAVREREGKFEVRSGSDRVVMVCGDVGSAQQHALMLNEAWRLGFKAGRREAREDAD